MRAARFLAACIASVTISTTAGTDAIAASNDRQIDEAVQYALEHLISGTSTAALFYGTQVVVMPLRTWKSVSGFYCRRYEITVTEPGAAPDVAQHTRCRTNDGVWRLVPGD